jgi:ubiquinone/menaquinone biosynthesis C-methylase UbiE
MAGDRILAPMGVHDGRAGWSEMADCYDATRAIPGGGEAAVPGLLAAHVRSLGVRRLLEVGVGTGRFAVPLAEAGIRVAGLDRSAEMLAVLRGKAGGARLPVVRGDALALPFRRAFDAVLFSHFLHLLDDRGALAAELRRVLLPGALVLVLDTGFTPQPAEERAVKAVRGHLDAARAPWTRGDNSRDRKYHEEILDALGGAVLPAADLGRYPSTGSIGRHLEALRARTWWTFRAYSAEAMEAAVAKARRDLLAEGADLAAEVPSPVGVRLLAGRLP